MQSFLLLLLLRPTVMSFIFCLFMFITLRWYVQTEWSGANKSDNNIVIPFAVHACFVA